MNKKINNLKSLKKELEFLENIGLRNDEIDVIMWNKMKALSRFR